MEQVGRRAAGGPKGAPWPAGHRCCLHRLRCVRDVVPGEVGEARVSDNHLICTKPFWLWSQRPPIPSGPLSWPGGLLTCMAVGFSAFKVWLLAGILCSIGIGPLLQN